MTVADNYRRFARWEAAGRSPLYAELSEGVAGDPAVLAFLAEQPLKKRQPNLLLGAVRFLCGTQPAYPSLRAVGGLKRAAASSREKRRQLSAISRRASRPSLDEPSHASGVTVAVAVAVAGGGTLVPWTAT